VLLEGANILISRERYLELEVKILNGAKFRTNFSSPCGYMDAFLHCFPTIPKFMLILPTILEFGVILPHSCGFTA
jgi:hypothetical protein